MRHRGVDKGNWHLVFAWLPRFTDSCVWVWLEPVARMRVGRLSGIHWWQYELPEKAVLR